MRSSNRSVSYHALAFDDDVECVEQEEIRRWLAQLRLEHRDLDEVVAHLQATQHYDLMRIQRLKKRKLKLKDMMARLESQLIPDLDA